MNIDERMFKEFECNIMQSFRYPDIEGVTSTCANHIQKL